MPFDHAELALLQKAIRLLADEESAKAYAKWLAISSIDDTGRQQERAAKDLLVKLNHYTRQTA